MPTKTQAQMQVKCFAMAYLFSKGITAANDLAEILDVPHEIVRRWHKRKEFHEGLDILGFKGDRNFTRKRRNLLRENRQAYQTAVTLYQQLTEQGVPERKRISEIATLLDNRYSWQRLNAWIRRWKKETTNDAD